MKRRKLTTLREYLEQVDTLYIRKTGRGQTQHAVVLHRLGVVDIQRVTMPIDTQVLGVVVCLGDIYLKLALGDSPYFVERVFYALSIDSDYRERSWDYSYLDMVRVGDGLWVVFET